MSPWVYTDFVRHRPTIESIAKTIANDLPVVEETKANLAPILSKGIETLVGAGSDRRVEMLQQFPENPIVSFLKRCTQPSYRRNMAAEQHLTQLAIWHQALALRDTIEAALEGGAGSDLQKNSLLERVWGKAIGAASDFTDTVFEARLRVDDGSVGRVPEDVLRERLMHREAVKAARQAAEPPRAQETSAQRPRVFESQAPEPTWRERLQDKPGWQIR